MNTDYPTTARDLMEIDAMPPEAYQPHAFSLPYFTAYSIQWLTEWEIPTTYENISVMNARMFPAEFALVGFPEFPDAMRTNRTLLQMRPKYRGLATSDPRRGVFLTQKGREAAKKVYEVIGAPRRAGAFVKHQAPALQPKDLARKHTRDPREIIDSAKRKLLYRRYEEGAMAETDVVHLLGLLSLYDHTPPKEVKKAFRQLRNDAVSIHDEAFLSFLNAAEERFHSYLNRTQ